MIGSPYSHLQPTVLPYKELCVYVGCGVRCKETQSLRGGEKAFLYQNIHSTRYGMITGAGALRAYRLQIIHGHLAQSCHHSCLKLSTFLFLRHSALQDICSGGAHCYWSLSLSVESRLHGKMACTCRSVTINGQMKQDLQTEDINRDRARNRNE